MAAAELVPRVPLAAIVGLIRLQILHRLPMALSAAVAQARQRQAAGRGQSERQILLVGRTVSGPARLVEAAEVEQVAVGMAVMPQAERVVLPVHQTAALEVVVSFNLLAAQEPSRVEAAQVAAWAARMAATAQMAKSN